MAIFMIETESVSSSGDSIKTISSELSSISSNVSGYDVNCEDNFDFAGAKQVIAHNIEACVNKINNTSKLIETVVSAHNNLQSQLKFNKEETSEDSSKSGSTSTASSENYSDDYSGSSGSRSSRHSGGGHSSSPFYGNISSDGLASGGLASALVGNTNVLGNQKLTDGIASPLLNDKFVSVAYAAPNEKSLNEDSKKFLNDSDLIYKDGYAMLDGRYVISCDSSYGKVGDIVRFTKNDGSIVECVIGVNTSSEKYKSTLNFIVDKDNPPTSKSEFYEKIVENSSKIENIGNVNSNSNSSASTNPTQSFTDSSTTTTESGESSTSTESNSTVTESTENSTTTESNSDSTDSTGTSIESDEPVTNDEKLTPVDNSADSVMANNTSSSFSDESLNSLINAKTDEDVQSVVNSIINDSSNNSNNV